jgi:predicted cupin superfamily sugar epimerase
MIEKMPTGGTIMSKAEAIVKKLGLEPLEVEGGMFCSTYTSAEEKDGRPIGSAIYYFLHGKAFSHMHKLTGDEMWFHQGGDAVELVNLYPDGTWTVTRLGGDVEAGEVPQHLVPKGVWMGARLAQGGDYALMATTNHPGYVPGCYTHGDPEALKQQYPEAADWIDALTGEAIFF